MSPGEMTDALFDLEFQVALVGPIDDALEDAVVVQVLDRQQRSTSVAAPPKWSA